MPRWWWWWVSEKSEKHTHFCAYVLHIQLNEIKDHRSFVRSFIRWIVRHGSSRLDKPMVHVHQKQRKHFSGKCMHSTFYTFNSLSQTKTEKQFMLKHPMHTATDLCVFGANGSGKGQNNHLTTHSYKNTHTHSRTHARTQKYKKKK